MTRQEILDIAMRQSAEDIGCRPEDFLSEKNVITTFRLGEKARKYLKEPITGDFVTYGNNAVAAVSDEIKDIVSEYMEKFEYYHLFETPNMNWLNDRLAQRGHRVCFMAEYYLPDPDRIPDAECKYATRLLEQSDFSSLYLPEWSNALCADRKQLDVLGIGAYDGERLVGLAACSADCDEMWQIGVDVLPTYRRQGIASSLTSALARQILKRGKVPFYCSAWSNIRSAGNAARSGFVPAWAEMTVKPSEIADGMKE